MNQKVKYIIMAAVALMALYGCEKPETPQVPDTPVEDQQPEVEPPICTYEYDGKEYPVYSMVFAADDSQIMIKISPFKEDPVMYYSQYRHLSSGTIMIEKTGDGAYRVVADVVLPDGKTFKFEY